MEVSQLVQVTARAAQAAAQAAAALQKMAGRKEGSKFTEAGNLVSKPDRYGTDDVEQDISKWTEFDDNFCACFFLRSPSTKLL